MSQSIFFFDTAAHAGMFNTKAPVAAVKAFERGYYPIHTHATAARLNREHPPEVLEAALVGSMFGWNVPGARVAAEYVEKQERAEALGSL